MKILTSNDRVLLRDVDFVDGTIEYDIELLDPAFSSIYFRWQNPEENECFYFRTGAAGNPFAIDGIQYAPHIKGVNTWDLLFHYQSNADFKKGDWNHIKLIISGKQMRVFVNDMEQPALQVPWLEGDTRKGRLAFDGQAIISNLQVKAGEVSGLSPEAGLDPTVNDVRYLRQWQVSEPIALNVDFDISYIPNDSTPWSTMTTERMGLVNLTRRFGGSNQRRIVWLRTTIYSAKAQERLLQMGFSDEVWVFINTLPVYFDKNYYGTPLMKSPDGRCTIENAAFHVPLKEGQNELLIGLANNFYGWGLIARLDKLDDLTLDIK